MSDITALLLAYEDAGLIGVIILLVIALVWLARFVLHRLAQRWKHQFAALVWEIQRRLKQLSDAAAQLEQAGRAYSPDDPEPYGSIAAELQQLLAQIHQAHQVHSEQFNRLCRQTLLFPRRRISRFVAGFWSQPRFWWRQYQGAERLRRMIQASLAEVELAQQLLVRLQNIPLAVTRRGRELYDLGDALTQLEQSLYLAGVRGQMLDAAADFTRQLEDRLKSLPISFFHESEELVLEQADKDSTIQAWQTLSEIESPLQQHHQQFQQWQTLYQETGQQLQVMRQAVDSAQLRLNQVPFQVDISSHLVELEQARMEAEELEARYQTPTLEALPELSARVLGVTEVLQWLVAQADALADKIRRFLSLAVLSADVLAQTEARMTEAAQAENYPLLWSEHQENLQYLSQLQANVDPTRLRLTPAELERYLVVTEQLSARVQQLRDAVSAALLERSRLISFFERPELAPEPEWLEKARQLQRQVSQYTSRNWPDDEITKIWSQAKQLAEQKEALVSDPGQPLPVQELGLYSSQVQELLAGIKDLQLRLQQIQETLAGLQQAEQEARQKLSQALQEVEWLLKRLPTFNFLRDSGLQKHQKRLDRLRREGRRLIGELDKQKSGVVAEKSRRAVDWTRECQEVMQQLHQELGAEIKHGARRLEDELKTLAEVAPLDREQAVRAARQSLTQEVGSPRRGPIAGAGEPLIEQLHNLLKRADDLYQSLQMLTGQVTDRIVPHLKKMNDAQQEAQASLKKLERSLGEESWPPVTCDLESIRRLVQQSEQGRTRLKQSGSTVREVLSTLDASIRYYENAQAKASEAMATLREERSRIEGIIDRVDQWQRRLELYRAHHSEDTAVVKAINERLGVIAAKKAEAHKPQLSPEQLRRVLAELEQVAYQPFQIQRNGKTDILKAGQIR